MKPSQFLRCHAYQPKKIDQILSEANRDKGFTSHIDTVRPVIWSLGSATQVKEAVKSYMAQPASVRRHDGTLAKRKRRKDHRCLVAGTVSWADSVAQTEASDYPKKSLDLYKLWIVKTFDWLKKQFGEKLVAMCSHRDESHPHIHFFVVGDAQRLHPGMKNELKDDTRLVVPAERFSAHKAGLKAWLNDFYEAVGKPCGLERTLNSRPTWRIKDRGTRSKLFEIEKLLAERPDPEIQKLRDEIWDSEWKSKRPRERF